MPALNEIRQEILQKKSGAQDEIRRNYLTKLSEYTGRDTILYATAFSSNKSALIPPFYLSLDQQDIQGFMSALHGVGNNKLDIIIHSPGGSMEAAEQIVTYLRHKYNDIRAIIPQNAMSAATMISCACNKIIMGKHSAIGPIDPQITFPTPNGAFTAPAQAILDEFERAKTEIKVDPQTAILWIEKLRAYPHGFLNLCETTMRLSKTKVTDWLSSYMFKGHHDGDKISAEIAEWLGTASEHNTHGRPIDINLAKSKGLDVDRLEDDQNLQELVLSAFHAAMITFDVTNCIKIIENQNGRGQFLQIEVNSN